MHRRMLGTLVQSRQSASCRIDYLKIHWVGKKMDYPCKACDGSGHRDIPVANGRGVLRQVCSNCNGMAFQSQSTRWARALKRLLNPSLLIKALQSQSTRWARALKKLLNPSLLIKALQSQSIRWARALKKLLNPSLLIKVLQSQSTRWAVEARKLATPENFLLVVCLGVTAFCIGVTVFWAFTDSGLYEWLKQLQFWALGRYYVIYTGIVTFLALWLPWFGVFLLFQKIWFFFCQVLNRPNHKDKE